MERFRLTQLAFDDLKAIGLYTQTTWGQEQRNRYLSQLDQAFHWLAQHPQRGRSCDDIRTGYRKHHVGRHLIFYRTAQGFIEIVRILHASMDIEEHLGDSF
jgi:toxin ParE1/3/4